MTELTREPGRSEQWAPSRRAALAQLEAFLPRAGQHYKRERNADPGPRCRDGVSQLSPWLRHRLLLESEVVEAVLDRHGFRAAEKFLQEVCWRTYWKGWLERRPDIWARYRHQVHEERARLDREPDLAERYTQAVSARTGIDCMDAWARELVTLGYLHNHARMWFASIWVFTLRLPWALGADFFLRHLLYGDPASNTLSWRWVAGLQTPGKTYLARADKIRRHTSGRFHPAEEQLAAHAEPVGTADLPEDRGVPASHEMPADPAAILLHDDDLRLPEPITGHLQTQGLAALTVADARSPGAVNEQVQRFAEVACRDGLERAADQLREPDPMLLHGSSGVDAVVRWARGTGAGAVVTPWPPCGPVSELLDQADPVLAAAGIRLHRLQRHWDRACWPHATRGFFAFWKPVSHRLRAGELSSGE